MNDDNFNKLVAAQNRSTLALLGWLLVFAGLGLLLCWLFPVLSPVQ